MVPCQHAFQAANGLETKPNPPHSISILASPMEPPQLTSLATGTELNQTAHALALIQTKLSSFEWFLPIVLDLHQVRMLAYRVHGELY